MGSSPLARARERERCSSPAHRFSNCLHWARASRASVQAVFRAQNETSLPHFVTCLGGSAVLVDANSADAIAVGNAVRRRSDDTIIKRNARLQFDIAPQIASDGYGLEQYGVVQADGSDAQAVLVEDQRAGRDMERRDVALKAQAHIGIAARHQLRLR